MLHSPSFAAARCLSAGGINNFSRQLVVLNAHRRYSTMNLLTARLHVVSEKKNNKNEKKNCFVSASSFWRLCILKYRKQNKRKKKKKKTPAAGVRRQYRPQARRACLAQLPKLSTNQEKSRCTHRLRPWNYPNQPGSATTTQQPRLEHIRMLFPLSPSSPSTADTLG